MIDDLATLLPRDLSLTVSTLIQRTASSKETIHCRGVTATRNDEELLLDLSATPLPDPSGDGDPHVLISFRNTRTVQTPSTSGDKQHSLDAEDAIHQRVNDLELELVSTKENLQATIEELQTTNEELQSTNEELQSANEELQSSNEELHSVNEELFTVNSIRT